MTDRRLRFLLAMGLLLLSLTAISLGGCTIPAEPAAIPDGEHVTVDATQASNNVESFDLADCAAAQGVTRQGDQLFENSQLCYQARAERLNDWSSCLQLGSDPFFSPAACLVGVTLRSGIYVCDRHGDPAFVQQCNELLMVQAGADPAIHQLEGLQTHRIEKTVQLDPGAGFNVDGVAVTVNDEGLVVLPDYYPAASHVCRPQEEPPLAVGTGVQGAYVYITGCTVQGAEVTIHYFRYDLPGLIFPNTL